MNAAKPAAKALHSSLEFVLAGDALFDPMGRVCRPEDVLAPGPLFIFLGRWEHYTKTFPSVPAGRVLFFPHGSDRDDYERACAAGVAYRVRQHDPRTMVMRVAMNAYRAGPHCHALVHVKDDGAVQVLSSDVCDAFKQRRPRQERMSDTAAIALVFIAAIGTGVIVGTKLL